MRTKLILYLLTTTLFLSCDFSEEMGGDYFELYYLPWDFHIEYTYMQEKDVVSHPCASRYVISNIDSVDKYKHLLISQLMDSGTQQVSKFPFDTKMVVYYHMRNGDTMKVFGSSAYYLHMKYQNSIYRGNIKLYKFNISLPDPMLKFQGTNNCFYLKDSV